MVPLGDEGGSSSRLQPLNRAGEGDQTADSSAYQFVVVVIDIVNGATAATASYLGHCCRPPGCAERQKCFQLSSCRTSRHHFGTEGVCRLPGLSKDNHNTSIKQPKRAETIAATPLICIFLVIIQLNCCSSAAACDLTGRLQSCHSGPDAHTTPRSSAIACNQKTAAVQTCVGCGNVVRAYEK